jgi:hypothetical protein
MRVRKVVLLVTAALSVGCRSVLGSDDDVCLAIPVPAVTVEALDSASRALVPGAGSLVVAREGAYADSARVSPSAPVAPLFARLAFDRPGTYEITVESPGYRVWRRSGVRVTEARCSVRTVALTALLQRLP